MKLFKKIIGAIVGMSMALGVGFAVSNSSKAVPVHAASPATLTFTAACGGSGTDSDENTWTITSDAAESTYDSTKGIHYGTGSKAVSYLRLTTSGISGTISQIKVNASGASGTSAKLNVTVGGDAFGTEKSLTATATEYTLTGSKSGEIIVSITQSSAKKALYCKSISVTYTIGHTHNWVAGTVHAPTCEEDGYTEYECSSCHDTKHDDITAALGHDYGEWIIDTAATCTIDGTKHRVCSRDTSHIENEIIPATGHTWEDGVCTVCGAIKSNIIMTAGTNSSACTVNGIEGIKVGTSKADGDMSITIPAGVTKIKLYIAAWKGTTSGNVELSDVVTDTLAISADDGISNNSPFTLNGDMVDFRVDLTVTAGTLTITSGTARRFVVWGATDKFASDFETAWGYLSCDATGTNPPSIGGDYSWASFKNIYNSLDAKEQEIILTNTTITSKYDYIVGKYGYEDFMHRNPPQIGNSRALVTPIINTTTTYTAVIVIGLIAITAIGAYIFFRKKREN